MFSLMICEKKQEKKMNPGKTDLLIEALAITGSLSDTKQALGKEKLFFSQQRPAASCSAHRY